MANEKDIQAHKLANAAAARASINACNRILTTLEQELRSAGVKGPEVTNALVIIRGAISGRDDEADNQFYAALNEVTGK